MAGTMTGISVKTFLLFFQFFIVSGYEYVSKVHKVPLDHFSFSTNHTFGMRYLINDTFWDPAAGPIFFYTGNEGDIELFANNTGFIWEIAPSFRALVVFAEHRYYGESLPFGNQSLTPEHRGYLTSQQALADYVDLIAYLNWNDSKPYRNPVIAFGGSYGGMLAAYMRMKYPHVVLGALASSAPIWQFTGMTPCDAFARIVTADFRAENKSCSDSIRKSWDAIRNITSKAEDGMKWLSQEWKLCTPLKNSTDLDEFKAWLEEVLGNLAMINYPYSTKFLSDVPAHPIREVCKSLQNPAKTDKDLLKSLFQGITVYFNYTGKANCLNAESASPYLNAWAWDYQACTEMVMPMCQDGINDMFEPRPWNLTAYSQECEKNWGVTPQPFLAEKIYGGKRINAASNIIFSVKKVQRLALLKDIPGVSPTPNEFGVHPIKMLLAECGSKTSGKSSKTFQFFDAANGLLDPWASGGVLKTSSKSLTVNIIPEGAHHLDLRASNPADPGSVRQSRLLYQKIFKIWIKEYDAELTF